MIGFMPVLVPTVILFVVALLVGKIWLLLLPVIGWPVAFLGLYMGWWGYGVGDGWQFMLLLWMFVGIVAVGLGLALRRLFLTP